MRKLLVRAILVLSGMVALAALVLLGLRSWVGWRYEGQIYDQVAHVPSPPATGSSAWPAAIVFGAGYWPSGRLSDALADRMDTAIELYQAGTVNKLLLSGDNRFADYNEPAVMADYALARGVPREDLVLDYAGRRTYDSCYRAGAIFGLHEAVLVTQRFHLPRALFTCANLQLDVAGVVADRQRYVRGRWYALRELFALARAWVDLNLLHPLPVLGDPIPVDWQRRAGSVSWASAQPPVRGHSSGAGRKRPRSPGRS